MVAMAVAGMAAADTAAVGVGVGLPQALQQVRSSAESPLRPIMDLRITVQDRATTTDLRRGMR
jgi:hypothetical protein